jgi:D-alanyl-lipoteichoic acid acyltransferase DltB (MBOAT superfamily)
MQATGTGTAADALLINTPAFWLLALAAIAALRLITDPTARAYVWAALNLLFLSLLLGKQIIWLLVGGLLLFILLRAYQNTTRRHLLTLAIVTAGTGLFLGYKSAFFANTDGTQWVQQLLGGIGFSFVFLRVVEISRALQEGRHDSPSAPDLVNYLVPFHMLAAGPIQAYDEFARQPSVLAALTNREMLEAAERVARGLFKKFVLAYALQKVFLTDLQADGLWFILEINILLLWLYLDFSAYSDIAVGLGRLMGVATPENFNRPWLSRNLIDFWDRWHISLSQWIRRNMFIPAQLNLMRRFPMVDPVLVASFAIGLSFFMAGIWHGLTRGWLLWGGMHALGLVAVRLYTAWMQRRRTPDQVARYRENSIILGAARLLTLEYAALAFAVPFILD